MKRNGTWAALAAFLIISMWSLVSSPPPSIDLARELAQLLDNAETSFNPTAAHEHWQDLATAVATTIDSTPLSQRECRDHLLRAHAAAMRGERLEQDVSAGAHLELAGELRRHLAAALNASLTLAAANEDRARRGRWITSTSVAAAAGLALACWFLAMRGIRRSGKTEPATEQTRLLAAAVRCAQEGILISKVGTASSPARIVFVNASFADMTGYEANELIGQPLEIIENRQINQPDFEQLERSMSSAQSLRLETLSRRKDGSVFHSDWHISPVRDDAGRTTHYASSLRDISQRKADEQALREQADALSLANQQLKDNQDQLIQSEKMASIGQLASGVAHEINNPVGYVSNNLETLAEDVRTLRRLIAEYQTLAEAVSAGKSSKATINRIDTFSEEHDVPMLLEDLEPMIAESLEGLERVQLIVRDLRDFARPADSAPEETDVNRQIEAALKITHNTLKYRCELRTHLADLPRIHSSPGQITQVVTNLLVNAVQAIPKRGTIEVSSELVGGKIVIRVADDGVGIAPEHHTEIFSPFFTTKPIGQGTGLGLAVSRGIVTGLGGTIEVNSTPGKGATFTVRLPVS
jgi:PAS domain S-box-containing protein